MLVSERMTRNLRSPSGIGSIEVKGEMGAAFPGKFGLKHDVPTARDVLQFYDKMMRSTESDRERKWFKHLVMHLVVLVGYDFIHEFGPDSVLTTFGWIAFSRMLLSLHVPMMGGFSFYVVEVEERSLLIMDPVGTSIHDDEMCVKHEVNAHLVLRGLQRILREHFADWYIPEDGWKVSFGYNMNEPCEMDDRWIYLGHY
ncbi:hypothetical protein D1007_20732 [Hordeum vulgare]|nr:hypothetical protein D1007_20732 [Hordeum vulgare]